MNVRCKTIVYALKSIRDGTTLTKCFVLGYLRKNRKQHKREGYKRFTSQYVFTTCVNLRCRSVMNERKQKLARACDFYSEKMYRNN